MISQLSIWQMAADVCLVTSVLFLALRSFRPPRPSAIVPQIAELEASLKKLIAEAEVAGRHLNEQLLRREQNIHKYLGEVERYEKELSLSIVEAEGLTKDLSLLCVQAKHLIPSRETSAERRDIAEPARARTLTERRPSEAVEREVPQDFSVRDHSPRASEWVDDLDGNKKKEERPRSAVRALQELYDRAEEMLKQGQDLAAVSERTKLPVEGVKRLAQMIEIEREEEMEERRSREQTRPRDPRLGALGFGRRQSSTL